LVYYSINDYDPTATEAAIQEMIEAEAAAEIARFEAKQRRKQAREEEKQRQRTWVQCQDEKQAAYGLKLSTHRSFLVICAKTTNKAKDI
jgi:hypothetical protein